MSAHQHSAHRRCRIDVGVSERRSGADVVLVEGEHGAGIVVAAWMLDPAACAALTVGEPTDTAFDAADNTFISDGYINSRVAKVDKDGNWIKSWGDDRGCRRSGGSQRR
jgi:hypothetical protein